MGGEGSGFRGEEGVGYGVWSIWVSAYTPPVQVNPCARVFSACGESRLRGQVCYPRTVSGCLYKESRLSVEGERCVVSTWSLLERFEVNKEEYTEDLTIRG